MLILAYDTETTGIARGSDYTHENNPFLASIAAILYDDQAQRIISSFNAAVRPDGWTMPPEAAAVNGFTTETLRSIGLPFEVVITTTIALAAKADLLVAHNADFDSKIIAAAMWRHMVSEEPQEELIHGLIRTWLSKPTYCTMKESKTLVQSLNKNGNLKYPKLAEAYRFFFDKEINNAHSANADAVAVLEIYLALQENKEVSL